MKEYELTDDEYSSIIQALDYAAKNAVHSEAAAKFRNAQATVNEQYNEQRTDDWRMNDKLQRAIDKLECVESMSKELPYEEQPREVMRTQLELAKAYIETAEDKMDMADEYHDND